jgi:putative PIN family toxin of toxin-antitoxin system
VKVVLDTNVVLSALVFGGVPQAVLSACLDGTFQMMATPEVLAEYRRAIEAYWTVHPETRDDESLRRIAAGCLAVPEVQKVRGVCRDPDDDKFLACALSAGALVVVSGDKALLATDGFEGLRVMTVRAFKNEFLGSKP